MKIVIDKRSQTPLNEQIFSAVVREIADGNLSKDECLPSIRFVARELGVGVITVKNAYERLEREGFIYTLAGKGCFVRGGKSGGESRLAIVRERLRAEVENARAVGVSRDDLIALISSLYDEKTE